MDRSEAVKAFQFRLFSALQGAVTSAMVHLGDRLGLFTALAAADGPISTDELAALTGLDERWVREWAYQQGAAKLIAVSANGSVAISDEGAIVLAEPDNDAYGVGSFHQIPDMFGVIDGLAESFRTGIGHDYDAQGCGVAVGMERSFEPWHRNHLVAEVIGALDGVSDRLAAGAAAADVGCGAGGAVLLLAEAFPASTFVGYDISHLALGRAAERLAASGLTNASFADPQTDPLPDDGSLTFVSTIECIHDMNDPAAVVTAVRAALADDGTWLLADMKALGSYTDNVEKNPMAALMYGFSVLSCLPSGLTAPGGAGLGTLGLPEAKARELATAAGFTRLRRLDIDHPLNAFYEIRP